MGIFTVAWGITGALVEILQCLPIESDWDPQIKGRCVNIGLFLVVMSSIIVVADVVILCLPIQQIWKLNMSRVRKVQLGGLFLLGSV